MPSTSPPSPTVSAKAAAFSGVPIRNTSTLTPCALRAGSLLARRGTSSCGARSPPCVRKTSAVLSSGAARKRERRSTGAGGVFLLLPLGVAG